MSSAEGALVTSIYRMSVRPARNVTIWTRGMRFGLKLSESWRVPFFATLIITGLHILHKKVETILYAHNHRASL